MDLFFCLGGFVRRRAGPALFNKLLKTGTQAYAPSPGRLFALAVIVLSYLPDRYFDRPVRLWLSAKWFGESVSPPQASAVRA